MEVLDHTGDHQATLMRDVYEHLIGKMVRVHLTGSHWIEGLLEAYNGYIIKIIDDDRATYLPIQNVASISEGI